MCYVRTVGVLYMCSNLYLKTKRTGSPGLLDNLYLYVALCNAFAARSRPTPCQGDRTSVATRQGARATRIKELRAQLNRTIPHALAVS
eukprot:2585733-Prymnesium_polylepis.1